MVKNFSLGGINTIYGVKDLQFSGWTQREVVYNGILSRGELFTAVLPTHGVSE